MGDVDGGKAPCHCRKIIWHLSMLMVRFYADGPLLYPSQHLNLNHDQRKKARAPCKGRKGKTTSNDSFTIPPWHHQYEATFCKRRMRFTLWSPETNLDWKTLQTQFKWSCTVSAIFPPLSHPYKLPFSAAARSSHPPRIERGPCGGITKCDGRTWIILIHILANTACPNLPMPCTKWKRDLNVIKTSLPQRYTDLFVSRCPTKEKTTSFLSASQI